MGDNNWSYWKRFFGERADRSAPRILDDDPALAGVPDSVARSLAIFQLGESGGGTVVEQARRSHIRTIDDDFAEAVALFVKEEHRHAELLACCVRALRGKLIRENWTARLFVFGRRLIGLRLKMMVLLAAEVVGICYYDLLASRIPAGNLSRVLGEIVEDEKAHLEFHCAFLRTQVTSIGRRWLFTVAWRLLMAAASIAVLLDHRHALSDLGIDAADVRARWNAVSRNAEELITRDSLIDRRGPALRLQCSQNGGSDHAVP